MKKPPSPPFSSHTSSPNLSAVTGICTGLCSLQSPNTPMISYLCPPRLLFSIKWRLISLLSSMEKGIEIGSSSMYDTLSLSSPHHRLPRLVGYWGSESLSKCIYQLCVRYTGGSLGCELSGTSIPCPTDSQNRELPPSVSHLRCPFV